MTSVLDGGLGIAADLATPRSVPWGGLVARLRASTGLRRLVPAPLAMAVLDAGHRLAVRRNPSRLDAARAAMEAVVGGTPLEADLDRLAFRHLCAWARGWELMWRPRLLSNMRVVGAAALAGLDPDRGVIFSTAHFGPLLGTAALPKLVGAIHAAVGDYMAAPEPPRGYNGYQIEQLRRLLVDTGYVPVLASGSALTFARVLRAGGRVILSLDVPGPAPVQFLGKPVELMTGTARLAMSTDAVVVPVVPLPTGRRWSLHLAAPLDPRAFETWEELLQSTASSVEGLILQAPEYLENPLRAGGWAVATRDGWRRSA
jgi:lauroyl/myristoyl acyltransferase